MGRSSLLTAFLVTTLALTGCKGDASPSAASSNGSSTSAEPRGPSILSGASRPVYRDVEGRFEVAMPSAPKIERHQSSIATPTVQMTANADDGTYYLLWVEFPSGIPVNVAGAFDGTQNDLCKQDSLTVTTHREFTFAGGFPARDVVATAQGSKPWKDSMRFVYVAPRLYSIFVRGVHDDVKAQAYLDSFRLVGQSSPSILDSAGSDAIPPPPWVSGTLGPAAASFPATPQEATKKENGPTGPMDVRTLRVTRGNIDMGIQLVVDPKPGPEAKVALPIRLEKARDTFKEGLGAKEVIHDEATTRGGHPARRVKLLLADHQGTAEFLVVFPKPDTMVIAVVALGEAPSAADLADSERFFDSFELIPSH